MPSHEVRYRNRALCLFESILLVVLISFLAVLNAYAYTEKQQTQRLEDTVRHLEEHMRAHGEGSAAYTRYFDIERSGGQLEEPYSSFSIPDGLRVAAYRKRVAYSGYESDIAVQFAWEPESNAAMIQYSYYINGAYYHYRLGKFDKQSANITVNH